MTLREVAGGLLGPGRVGVVLGLVVGMGWGVSGLAVQGQVQGELRPAATAGVGLVSGTDAVSGIVWTRISLAPAGAQGSDAAAMLTVQCSQNGGRRQIDLDFDFGGADRSFHAPPKADPVTHVLRRPPKLELRMEFGGYHPFKRQFQALPSGEFRYNEPSLHSSNLEPLGFFLQFMNSVPELRISYADRKMGEQVAEFDTAALVEQVRKTALCGP